jgi:hypothetical protein
VRGDAVPSESDDEGPYRGWIVSTVPFQVNEKSRDVGHDGMIGSPDGFDVAHVVPGPGGLPLSEKYVTIAVSIDE